jgi:hypothetical protein
MPKLLHGLKDIHTVITNQRKIGGATEAKSIRLRSGEEYSNPVFTSLDVAGGQFVSIGFITENGDNMIIHVNEIGVIKGLSHKLICQITNEKAKELLLEDLLHYIKRLCEVNKGFVTRPFKDELTKLVCDISLEEIKKQKIALPFQIETNVVPIDDRLFA